MNIKRLDIIFYAIISLIILTGTLQTCIKPMNLRQAKFVYAEFHE